MKVIVCSLAPPRVVSVERYLDLDTRSEISSALVLGGEAEQRACAVCVRAFGLAEDKTREARDPRLFADLLVVVFHGPRPPPPRPRSRVVESSGLTWWDDGVETHYYFFSILPRTGTGLMCLPSETGKLREVCAARCFVGFLLFHKILSLPVRDPHACVSHTTTLVFGSGTAVFFVLVLICFMVRYVLFMVRYVCLAFSPQCCRTRMPRSVAPR